MWREIQICKFIRKREKKSEKNFEIKDISELREKLWNIKIKD